MMFYFIGPFGSAYVALKWEIPLEKTAGVGAIIVTVMHIINMYHLQQVRSNIQAVIDGITEIQGQINQCVSQDQQLNAAQIEMAIYDLAGRPANNALIANLTLILWTLTPVIVVLQFKYKHNVDKDDNYNKDNED